MENLNAKEVTVTRKINLGNYENVDVSVTFAIDANNPTVCVDEAIRYVNYTAQIAKGHSFILGEKNVAKLNKAKERIESLKVKADAIIFGWSDEEVKTKLTEIASRYKVEDVITEPDIF
mgnify:CR=1 FL=1